MDSEKIKKIEEKLDKFKKESKLEEIKSDFEGYIYAGIILNHLLSQTSSSKSKLEILSKYFISVNNVKQLKDKILFLTTKYSHNLKVNYKMWGRINEVLLKYCFRDKKVKDNLIPLFIGFYMNFWLNEGNTKNDKKI